MAVAPSSRSLFSTSYDGTAGTYLDIPRVSNGSGGKVSVSCWIKPTLAETYGGVIRTFLTTTPGSGDYALIVFSNGDINWLADSNSRYGNNTFPGLTANVWSHILATYDGGSTRKIYVNGSSIGTLSGTALGGGWAATARIGDLYPDTGYRYEGKLDDVAVYFTELTSGNASDLANGLIDPLSLTPAAYWRMEEGTNTTASDSSGNANTGTLNGGVTWSGDAPAYLQDYATSGYQTGSTYSFSYRNGAVGGDKSYMSIGVSMLSVVGSSVSSITVDGVSATFQLAKASVSGAVRVEYWDLLLPDTPYATALTVSVTLSAALDSITSCQVFKGVNSSPIDKTSSASATNVGAADATVSVTTVIDADYLFAVVATDDTAVTVGTGQTEAENVSGTIGTGAISYKGPISPAGSATMYWTGVGALATWSIIVVAFQPLQAAAARFPKNVVHSQAIQISNFW